MIEYPDGLKDTGRDIGDLDSVPDGPWTTRETARRSVNLFPIQLEGEKLTREWFSAGVGDDDPVLRGGGVELGCGVGLWCGKEGDPKKCKRHYSDDKEHRDGYRPLEFCERHGGSRKKRESGQLVPGCSTVVIYIIIPNVKSHVCI